MGARSAGHQRRLMADPQASTSPSVSPACRASAGRAPCRRCWHRHRRRHRYQPPDPTTPPSPAVVPSPIGASSMPPPSRRLSPPPQSTTLLRFDVSAQRWRGSVSSSSCETPRREGGGGGNSGGAASPAKCCGSRDRDEAIFLRKTQTITQEYLTREDAGVRSGRGGRRRRVNNRRTGRIRLCQRAST